MNSRHKVFLQSFQESVKKRHDDNAAQVQGRRTRKNPNKNNMKFSLRLQGRYSLRNLTLAL